MEEKSEIEQILMNYGFRKLHIEEVEQVYQQIKNAVHTGLARREKPTESDGGVMAIPTKSNFITSAQWEQVKEGELIVVGNYGGTHWVTGLRKKVKDGLEKVGDDVQTRFGIHDRSHTFDGFVNLIYNQIAKLNQVGLSNAKLIGISLGFAQVAERTENGLDARLIPKNMTKHWIITDMGNLPHTSLIGESLLNKFNLTFVNLKKIYIRNDAEAIGNDVRLPAVNQLPLTLVAGTGLNVVVTRQSDGQNINLEIGRTQINLDTFSVVEYMFYDKKVPDLKNIIEYHIGGDYIKSKVLYGLRNLASIKNMHRIYELYEADTQGDILSRFVRKEESLDMNLEDLNTAAIISIIALAQAGQLIACAFAAVVDASGYTNIVHSQETAIATDGSMLHKAEIVMQEFMNTFRYFLHTNKIKPFEANGLDGIAKFALVKEQEARNM